MSSALTSPRCYATECLPPRARRSPPRRRVRGRSSATGRQHGPPRWSDSTKPPSHHRRRADRRGPRPLPYASGWPPSGTSRSANRPDGPRRRRSSVIAVAAARTPFCGCRTSRSRQSVLLQVHPITTESEPFAHSVSIRYCAEYVVCRPSSCPHPAQTNT
jgi:hypothetical protein